MKMSPRYLFLVFDVIVILFTLAQAESVSHWMFWVLNKDEAKVLFVMMKLGKTGMKNIDVNNIKLDLRFGAETFEMNIENVQDMGNKVYQLTINTVPCQGSMIEVTLKNLSGSKLFSHFAHQFLNAKCP